MTRTLKNIFQIEPTSVCNFKCEYCIHPLLKRDKRHMEWETFINAMSWLLFLREKRGGYQNEIALTGVGEPFLHPSLPDMIEYCRRACPEARITVSTNGSKITKALCDQIKEHKPLIFVSAHDQMKAAKAQKYLTDAGIYAQTNRSFNGSSFDWAGQVDWPCRAGLVNCFYLKTGSGVVLQDGRIVHCCMDGDGLDVIGDVADKPTTEIEMKPFDLCKSCHMNSEV